MNWDKLREILNGMAESEEGKALLETQVIGFMGGDGAVPVHLSQSLVDGELILLPMETAKE